MRYTACLFVLVLIGCGDISNPPEESGPAVPVFGDFTAGTFKYLLKEKGFTEQSSHIGIDLRGQYRYELKDGPGIYVVFIYIEDSVEISSIIFKAYSPVSKTFGVDMAGWIASVPFEGSSPSNAMAWARENWGRDATHNIGQGKFRTSATPEGNALEIAPLFGRGDGAK